MFCAPERAASSNGTTYNYLAELDSSYQHTGVVYWIKNSDDPTSFALSPKFKYDAGSSVENIIDRKEITANAISTAETLTIETNGEIKNIAIYSVSGQFVKYNDSPTTTINISSLPKGVYIVKMNIDGKEFTQKIVK